jgi:hypothetical protein
LEKETLLSSDASDSKMPGTSEQSRKRLRRQQKTYGGIKRLKLLLSGNSAEGRDKVNREGIVNLVNLLDRRRWHILKEERSEDESAEGEITNYIISIWLHKSELEELRSVDAAVRPIQKARYQPSWEVHVTVPGEMLPLSKLVEFESSMRRRQTLRSWNAEP